MMDPEREKAAFLESPYDPRKNKTVKCFCGRKRLSLSVLERIDAIITEEKEGRKA